MIPNSARPYGNWNGWTEAPTVTSVHGDGALFTTLRDQLRWEQIVMKNDGKHLSQTLMNKSQSPIASSYAQDYGYGLMFDSRYGLDFTYHDGATSAYNATFLRLPSHKMSIVVMGNNRNIIANYVAWNIATQVLGLKNQTVSSYPTSPDEIENLQQVKMVVGSYRGEDGSVIKIKEKDGLLYREMYQRDPANLVCAQGGLFVYEEEKFKGLKMNFSRIGEPDQQFTLYRADIEPSTYYKLSNLEMNDFDKSGLNGRFYNDETDTEIILQFEEGHTYSLTKNGRKRKAELISGDYLRMMDSYKIRVIRDQKDQIIGLNVENNRIQNVIFARN